MLKALAITMALSGAPATTVPVVPYPHAQQPATPNEQKLDDALKDLDAALADLERAVKERQAREQMQVKP